MKRNILLLSAALLVLAGSVDGQKAGGLGCLQNR